MSMDNLENMEGMEEIEVETIIMPMEDGTDMEFAIWDDFEFEGKSYLVVAPIEGDMIGDDQYIYEYEEDGEDTVIHYIEDEQAYIRIAEAYAALCDEELDQPVS